MAPQQAIETCFAKYFDFEGDAGRSEFWWFFGFVAVMGYLLSTVLGPKVASIFWLGTFLPLLAVTTRRLHHTNRSGWWQLVGFVPLVGWLVLAYFLVQEGDGLSAA